MIIAIASDDGMNVAEDPGQCGGFVIFEVGPSSAVRVGYRSNAYARNGEDDDDGQRAPSAAGRAYEPLIAELSDCGALVSGDMADALKRELRSGVIDAYVCREGTVDQAAQLFAQGHLRKL